MLESRRQKSPSKVGFPWLSRVRKCFTMHKGPVFVGLAFAGLLSGHSVDAGIAWDDGIISERIVRAAISGVERLTSIVGKSSGLPLRADGGGDGGGSDGSGSGDGSSGDGTGDSTSTDSTSTDSTAAPDGSAAAPSSDPTADPNAVTQNADETENALTPEMNAIMSIPTTDPRGGTVTPTTTTTTDDALDDVPVGAPGASGLRGVTPAAAPVDVGIHAVIVSGAMTPWDAIGKVPGVGTVTVTGGIVALGTTPIRGEPPGGGPQPSWLRLVPDLDLLNGSVIPPVVPNVIDVRITRYSIEAVEKPNN